MPILKDPAEGLFASTETDPGLEYLESQRWWSHRAPSDLRRVERFYEFERRFPERVRRSKEYPFVERIELKADVSKLNMPVSALLGRRKTSREPGSRPATLTEVATLLMASYGMQSKLPGGGDPSRPRSRTTPSPGGLFSSEIYYLSLNTEGLPRGVYHFQPELGVLEVLPGSLPPELAAGLIPGVGETRGIEAASGIIVVTSVLGRMRIKYGHRALRFALLEAGCICQNLDLISAGLELRIWHQGSINEESIRGILEIDGAEEAAVHGSILLGHE